MRFPTIPTLIRTLHTFANTTIRATNPAFNVSRLYNPPHRATTFQSMPLPFIGALFGTSSNMADNTKFPVQKTEGEWQAQLSPGMSGTFPSHVSTMIRKSEANPPTRAIPHSP